MTAAPLGIASPLWQEGLKLCADPGSRFGRCVSNDLLELLDVLERRPDHFLNRGPLVGFRLGAHCVTPRDEIANAIGRYTVLELACDPPGWHAEIEAWRDTYEDVVVAFRRTSGAGWPPPATGSG